MKIFRGSFPIVSCETWTAPCKSQTCSRWYFRANHPVKTVMEKGQETWGEKCSETASVQNSLCKDSRALAFLPCCCSYFLGVMVGLSFTYRNRKWRLMKLSQKKTPTGLAGKEKCKDWIASWTGKKKGCLMNFFSGGCLRNIHWDVCVFVDKHFRRECAHCNLLLGKEKHHSCCWR